MVHFFWVIPLVLLIAYIGSPRFRGTMGEQRVRRILDAMLPNTQYAVLHGLTLPASGGTTRIDHLVVSQFGIFVIESVYLRGIISGTKVQDRWMQRRLGRSNRVENPIHQNYLHIAALERLLKLPRSRFHSIVVLMGHRGFRGTIPSGVVPVEKLISCIRKSGQKLLEGEAANEALIKIKNARLDQHNGLVLDRWKLLRLFLLITLIIGCLFAFKDQLLLINDHLQQMRETRSAPELFHSNGTRKSEQELWEESLICAYSVDTGKCACYETSGSKIELGEDHCRSLAERGSILKR